VRGIRSGTVPSGQAITAYPSAGGAYIVTKDNLGSRWALVAGSAGIEQVHIQPVA
jgi:amino acid transporter